MSIKNSLSEGTDGGKADQQASRAVSFGALVLGAEASYLSMDILTKRGAKKRRCECKRGTKAPPMLSDFIPPGVYFECVGGPRTLEERDFFVVNLLVRILSIIEMILVDRPCAMGV